MPRLPISLFCIIAVVLGDYDLKCLQTTLDRDYAEGFVSLPINFEGDKAFVIDGAKGITDDIKLHSQENYPLNSQMCSALVEKKDLESCVIFRFEVFGKPYLTLAGIYRINGQKNLYSRYGYAICQKTWNFVPGANDFCDRDFFAFSAKDKECAPEMSFIVSSRIERQDCVDDMFTLISLQGYTAKLLVVPVTPLESPLNDQNIRLVRSESYYKDKDDLNKACEHLKYQVKHDQDGLGFTSCHNLYVEINLKPYTIMYGIRDEVHTFPFGDPITLPKISSDPEWMQCQEGYEVNPRLFFDCTGNGHDIEIYFFKEGTPCIANNPLLGIGTPKRLHF